MTNSKKLVSQVHAMRNSYGKQFASEKAAILDSINLKTVSNKKDLQLLYTTLLFLVAHPDNKTIYGLANERLQELQDHLQANEKLQRNLFNTGLTNTSLCAAFSFYMVSWLRKTRPREIRLSSFEADDAKIQSILSVVMSKTESEILQDGNAEWKGWLEQLRKPTTELLDQLIDIFGSSDIRSEVKEELWNTIGINVEIDFSSHCCLPQSLFKTYYHRSLIKKDIDSDFTIEGPVPAKLTETEASQVIDCSRMVLLRNLREIDPISFTSAKLVSYYRLQRGISVALVGMVPEYRHPVESYMGYVVFKNGLPVAYAGSWILFNSARIGLNIFPDYRGGESKYIFHQVLQLHAKVYRLKRFTVDPYQVGKDNSDGIHSGAFWIYYHAGFRPLQKQQYELAAAEALKINADHAYRSPAAVLKTLANSRQQLVLQKDAVGFDATDLSRVYAGIISKKYKSKRRHAEKSAVKKLAGILQIKNYQDDNMQFVLQNWAVLLLINETELRKNNRLKTVLKKLFVLKTTGSEEAYIKLQQQSADLEELLTKLVKTYIVH